MCAAVSIYSLTISDLMSTYSFTKDQADQVWAVGDKEHQEKIIGGHEFRSTGRIHDEGDEYYIHVIGPHGFELSRYHYEG
jgi:hypothetical protein